MSSGLGAKTSKTSRPSGRERGAGSRQRLDPLAVVGQMEVRAERADDERHRLVDRRCAEITEAQVEELGDAFVLGAPTAGSEHLARGIDPDHLDALLRDRDRDPAGSDAELHDGPARLARLGDVEPDVLGHAAAPRVVELGDRVVGAGPVTNLAHIRHSGVQLSSIRSNRRHAVPHPGGRNGLVDDATQWRAIGSPGALDEWSARTAHAGFRATQMNSRSSLPSGRRSKSPYERLDLEPRDLDQAFPFGAVDPPQRELPLALARLADPGGDVDPAVGRVVLRALPDPAVLGVLTDTLSESRAAISGSKTNTFHANRPPGRSAAATSSKTRLRSCQVGMCRSARKGE